MGHKGRGYAIEHRSWHILTSRLIETLKNVDNPNENINRNLALFG